MDLKLFFWTWKMEKIITFWTIFFKKMSWQIFFKIFSGNNFFCFCHIPQLPLPPHHSSNGPSLRYTFQEHIWQSKIIFKRMAHGLHWKHAFPLNGCILGRQQLIKWSFLNKFEQRVLYLLVIFVTHHPQEMCLSSNHLLMKMVGLVTQNVDQVHPIQGFCHLFEVKVAGLVTQNVDQVHPMQGFGHLLEVKVAGVVTQNVDQIHPMQTQPSQAFHYYFHCCCVQQAVPSHLVTFLLLPFLLLHHLLWNKICY